MARAISSFPVPIALSAVLLWGSGVWPGIAAGAFLVNFWTPVPAQAALGIALGNTSSALVGGYLLRRLADSQFRICRFTRSGGPHFSRCSGKHISGCNPRYHDSLPGRCACVVGFRHGMACLVVR